MTKKFDFVSNALDWISNKPFMFLEGLEHVDQFFSEGIHVSGHMTKQVFGFHC